MTLPQAKEKEVWAVPMTKVGRNFYAYEVDKYRLGNNIYKHLQDKGMKQIDLARALNESKQQVSRWMNGARMPQIVTLLKISRILDVSPDDLLEGVLIEK